MPQLVLNLDWSDYDNKKRKTVDARFFSCTEPWEVDYLIDKIRKVYPHYEKVSIKMAIQACCRISNSNNPRKEFVECVMRKLNAK
jgi:hypothetical protein